MNGYQLFPVYIEHTLIIIVVFPMIYKIFEIFYRKLPTCVEEIYPEYDRCKLITCLTPYYMTKINESDYDLYENFDVITSDGIYPIKINKWVGKPKSIRLSFDMTSMTPIVFNDMVKNKIGLYILGAKQEDLEKSVNTIKRHFPLLKINGYHHGYINKNKDHIIQNIIKSGAKVCIIGMGAPLQDEMAVRLQRAGFVGSVYTCGGFIHQITNGIMSYPKWADKYNMRFVYRWIHEKGVFMRTPKQIWGCLQYAWWLLYLKK